MWLEVRQGPLSRGEYGIPGCDSLEHICHICRQCWVLKICSFGVGATLELKPLWQGIGQYCTQWVATHLTWEDRTVVWGTGAGAEPSSLPQICLVRGQRMSCGGWLDGVSQHHSLLFLHRSPLLLIYGWPGPALSSFPDPVSPSAV